MTISLALSHENGTISPCERPVLWIVLLIPAPPGVGLLRRPWEVTYVLGGLSMDVDCEFQRSFE